MNKKSLGIYVSSYDGCSDLWDNFFMLFDTFWSDCPYNVYLINNEKKYYHEKVNVINTGKEVNWFYRTIKSLEMIETDYIIFFLEDYFISKLVKNEDIEEIIDFISNNDVYYYQLSKGHSKSKNLVRTKVSPSIGYPVSLQLAVWDRNKLIDILKEINGSTPWDVEVYFKNKYNSGNEMIDGVYHDTRDLFGYKNGVLRGKWIRKTLKYYKKKGINIDVGDRKVLSIGNTIKFNLAVFIHRRFPKKIKKIIKTILTKVKYRYI